MWVCVCSDSHPNIYLDSTKLEKMDAEGIQSLISNSANLYGNLYLHTPNFMISLAYNDIPLDLFPDLSIPDRLSSFGRPDNYLFLSTSMESDDIYLFIEIRHQIKQKIPRLIVSFSSAESETLTVGEMMEKLSRMSKLEFSVSTFLVGATVLTMDAKVGDFLNYQNFPDLAAIVEFPEKTIRELQHRSNIVHEIVETEKQYLQDLKDIIEYWQPEIVKRNLMAPNELEVIFKDVSSIYNCHKEFLSSISNAEDGYASCIAPIFLEFCDFFKVSNHFISTYPRIQEIINLKSQNRNFSSALHEIQQIIDGRDFLSYLITPVQRMPRYLLFMREMLKRTPAGHPDCILLQYAAERVEVTTLSAEVQSERANQQTQLYKLQERLKKANITIVNPSRRIIKSYQVMLTVQKKESRAILYVCNDILLIIKDHTRYVTLVLIAPIIAFHYLPILGDFRSINITTFYKGRREMKLTFDKSEERSSFFSLLEAQQLEQLPPLDNTKYIIWSYDAISETIPSICKTSAISNNDCVIFFGGVYGTQKSPSNDFLTYDRASLNGMPLSRMTTTEGTIPSRRRHTITYFDNFIYLVGGLNLQKECPEIMRLDLNSCSWSHFCPRFTISRYGHTTVVYNSDLYVYGGLSKQSEFASDQILRLNTATQKMEIMQVSGEWPPTRSDHSAVVFNNKMYIFGGKGKNGSILKDFWAFDFKTNTWMQLRTKGDPLTPHKKHTAFLVNHEMLVIGGKTNIPHVNSPKPYFCQSFCIDLITLFSRKVVDVGNVPTSLKHFSGGMMSNFNIVIYGGIEGKTPLNALYGLRICNSWQKEIEKMAKVEEPQKVSSESWKKFTSGKKCFTVIAHRSTYIPQAASPQKRVNFVPTNLSTMAGGDFSVLSRSMERFSGINSNGNNPNLVRIGKNFNTIRPGSIAHNKQEPEQTPQLTPMESRNNRRQSIAPGTIVLPKMVYLQKERESNRKNKRWRPSGPNKSKQMSPLQRSAARRYTEPDANYQYDPEELDRLASSPTSPPNKSEDPNTENIQISPETSPNSATAKKKRKRSSSTKNPNHDNHSSHHSKTTSGNNLNSNSTTTTTTATTTGPQMLPFEGQMTGEAVADAHKMGRTSMSPDFGCRSSTTSSSGPETRIGLLEMKPKRVPAIVEKSRHKKKPTKVWRPAQKE